MAKIVHYEVYVDKGYGWKLEERFPSDRRNEAFELTKELESGNVAVKIIQEIYDVRTNSYFEVVDYVSGLQKRQNPRFKEYAGKKPYRGTFDNSRNDSGGFFPSREVLQALLKLILIVALCLVLAEALLILLTPIIDAFVLVEGQKPVKFIIFFGMFLLLTIPLILKKVPWHIFFHKRVVVSASENKILQKGENLLRRYQTGDDYEQPISPSYPEAPLEYKQYVIEFLSQIISNLDRKSAIRDSFSKLGVKFLIYGGCLELSRYSGLGLTQANSLLNEAFFIIDGALPDVQAFYEAKKAYGDNRNATYLTGVGSYIMAQTIRERPIDADLLKKAFAMWEAMGDHSPAEGEEAEAEVDELFYCTLYMHHTVKLHDTSDFTNAGQVEKINHHIAKEIEQIAGELNGKKTADSDGITVFNFLSVQDAILFCMDFFDNFAEYMTEVNDENLLIANKFVLLSSNTNTGKEFIQDIFEHTYDGEIISDEEIRNKNHNHLYNFEFLGDKLLKTSGEKVGLYRVIH